MKIVDVVFVQDWDHFMDEVGDAPDWGEWDEVARYLSQWDFGDETDDAHTLDDDPAGSDDDRVWCVIDGIEYRLTFNEHLRYVGLTRSPLVRV